MRLTTALTLTTMITASEVYACPDHAEDRKNTTPTEYCAKFDLNKDTKKDYEVCVISMDRRPIKIVQRFYDDQHALPVKELEDRDGNGQADFITVRGFREEGFTQFEYDINTNPITETRIEYDATGKLMSTTILFDPSPKRE